jgi:hypothetical protein
MGLHTTPHMPLRKIKESQYIQAHTILKKHAREYADKPVLVLGGKLDKVRKVAERYFCLCLLVYPHLTLEYSYGFQEVYTTLDVLASNPAFVSSSAGSSGHLIHFLGCGHSTH